MKNLRWFWGIFFILATVLLIAGGLGAFARFGFWSLLGTALLIAILVQSAISRVFIGVFLPIGLIYLIFRPILGWPHLSFWLILAAAVLLSIGFHCLFRGKPGQAWCSCGGIRTEPPASDNNDDSFPEISVSFSSQSRYLHTDNLRGGRLHASFGSLEAYFDGVTLNPEGAELFLECSFGSIRLFLPKSWQVTDKTRTSMGSVNFTGSPAPGENPPRLTLTGSVSFSGVEVTYV